MFSITMSLNKRLYNRLWVAQYEIGSNINTQFWRTLAPIPPWRQRRKYRRDSTCILESEIRIHAMYYMAWIQTLKRSVSFSTFLSETKSNFHYRKRNRSSKRIKTSIIIMKMCVLYKNFMTISAQTVAVIQITRKSSIISKLIMNVISLVLSSDMQLVHLSLLTIVTGWTGPL